MATTAKFPKIICRVKALYAFYSTEKSSLSFEKDEYIDVLSQLDSGWWDGWCKGNRGWFPSNYVQIVEVNPEFAGNKNQANQLLNSNRKSIPRHRTHESDESEEDSRAFNMMKSKRISRTSRPNSLILSHSSKPKQNRYPVYTNPLSSAYHEEDSQQKDSENLPEGWTLQIADDGFTKFYFNQQTGGLRWNHPGILDSDDENYTSAEEYDTSSRYSDRTLVYQKESHPLDNFEDYSDFGRPAKTPKPTVSSAGNEESQINLMNYWTKRTTPQGKTYYGNSITNETTWNYDDIDPATGRLKKSQSNDASLDTKEVPETGDKFAGNSERHVNNPLNLIGDEDEPMTWKCIAIEIAQAVQNLNKVVAQGENAIIYRQKISAVVDAVRLMLYCSRSVDKDSSHLQDPEIKEPLRVVLSSLAKLILSAKVINDSNPDVNSKVQRDAGDVLNAVRKFVLVCQTKNVAIEQINPKFILIDNDILAETGLDDNIKLEDRRKSSTNLVTQSKAKYPLNQDLIVSLQTHAKQIIGSTDALCKASSYICTLDQRQNDQESSPAEESSSVLDARARSNVILLFQNLSSQIGAYLAILSDIDISHVEAAQIQSLPKFQSSKQKLYNYVGLLFSAVQKLTDTQSDLTSTITAIEQTVAKFEDTIENVFSNVIQMVGERKIWLMKSGEGGNISLDNGPRSPIQSQFDMEVTKKIRPHRGSINESDSSTTDGSGTPILTRIYNRQGSQTGRSLDNAVLKRQYSFGQGASNQENKPELWFLGYDYAEDDIEFTQEKSIRGGTLRALVERLTLHDYIDMSFIANFLLTYRSFCTTEEFVDLLLERYNLAPPEELTPEELEIWTDKKQKLVRLRVFNVMKNWLENYYNDEDEFILNKLQVFANTVICDSSSFSAEQLNRLIRKRRELDANGGGLKKLIPNTMNGPMPIMPKNTQQIRLLDTDPLELARQLTILDFKLYSSIKPIECLGKAWSKDSADADNVKQSIDYCNRLTAWVTGSILNNKEAKKRVVVIKHWAQVANRCLELNNYNTCMAILSAFDNSAIGRLKKTWELVSSRTSNSLAQIRKLMGSNRNFQEYRIMIHSVNPPCIPFLGIYLQDLTFIEDGNPDILKTSKSLINFAKQQKSAEVIREIKQFQSPPYIFQYVPEIQDYIKHQLETSRDVDFLYEKSLELEPRAAPIDSTA
ncbi:ras guanine nucleotide exchange factor domain-containing protein [Choanephora cucurbitarum]|nr:ras guanine nucleotide exchange factor domain-containing protein [Choanephora cucurbitarum]